MLHSGVVADKAGTEDGLQLSAIIRNIIPNHINYILSQFKCDDNLLKYYIFFAALDFDFDAINSIVKENFSDKQYKKFLDYMFVLDDPDVRMDSARLYDLLDKEVML